MMACFIGRRLSPATGTKDAKDKTEHNLSRPPSLPSRLRGTPLHPFLDQTFSYTISAPEVESSGDSQSSSLASGSRRKLSISRTAKFMLSTLSMATQALIHFDLAQYSLSNKATSVPG